MGLISATIPTVNQTRFTEETDTRTSLATIVTLVNGNIDGFNAPAHKSQYRTIARADGNVANGAPAGTQIAPLCGSTGDFRSGVSSASDIPVLVIYTAADYAVTGLTTRLRLRTWTQTNATTPGVNLTFGLYPLSSTGDTTNMTFTLGAVVAASVVTRNAPAASTLYSDASSDFAAPADGTYLFGCVFSGVTAGVVGLGWELQVRNV